VHADRAGSCVPHGVRQRLLGNSGDLAFDTGAERGQIFDNELDRDVGRTARQLRGSLEHGSDVS